MRKRNKKKRVTRVLDSMNPKIGNAPSSPTVDQFARNNSRPLFTRKFFSNGGGPRGGAQTFIVKIPTNQTHLHNQKQIVECNDSIDGSIIFMIIFIFVALTNTARYRFRKVKKKLSSLLSKVKVKLKSKKIFVKYKHLKK